MATTKEYASTLWNNLSSGLDAIYQKYKTLKDEEAARYDQAIAAVDPEYRTLKNRAATQSDIAIANTDRRLAEKGLAASGEAIKSEILSRAALQENLTAIDLAARQQKEKLTSEKRENEAKLSAEGDGEVAKYVYQMNQAYFDQLNADRDAELKREQAELNNRLAEAELKLKEQKQEFEQQIALAKAAASSASKGSSSSNGSASGSVKTEKPASTVLGVGGSKLEFFDGVDNLSPSSVKPKALVDTLVRQHSEKDYAGSTIVNRDALKRSLENVIHNTKIDVDYRFEVSFYAKSLGYL